LAAREAAGQGFLVGTPGIALLGRGTSPLPRAGESNTTPRCAGASGGVRNAFSPVFKKKKKKKKNQFTIFTIEINSRD